MNWFPPCSKWYNFSCSKCDTKNVLPAPMNNKVFFPKYIRSKILSNCSSLYSLFSPEFQSQPFPMEFPGISRDPNAMEFCWAKIPRSIRWKVSRNLHASGLSFQHSRLGSTKQCAEWYFSQKKMLEHLPTLVGIYRTYINSMCWSIQLSHIMSYIHLDNY